ncbi:hypothetical protein F4820DRAFT_207065 [Hypoxylon rubiginosum]|uniref:Uncharacterized protein n=1 Tax=Hypoxylon rubiginosum TaxID=110542 RepID=A0ACB9YI47_9PEZI|nr:hypothetical protein F4820DRAFT_207065 [Hypoxylon rubiginosum]
MHHQILIASTLLLGAVTTVYAAPSTSNLETRNASPQCWYGNDFPAQSDWLSFDSLFEKWRPQFQAQGDTDHELDVMKDALKSYSQQGGFSAALATAMMIQESAGNTCRVCGDGGVSCGLLQVRGAPKDCDGKAHPCPDSSIRKAIECGAVGCGVEGSNIKSCVASRGQKWGEVLRCYNTGSVTDPSNLRVASPGDPRYVHLIANILLGAGYAELSELGGAKCGF